MDYTNAYASRQVLAEMEHTCSNVDTDSTADNQPGPGRLVDNCLVYAGRHLEVLLAKSAAKIGKKPASAANHRLDVESAVIPHNTNEDVRQQQFVGQKSGRNCSVLDPDSTVSNLTGPGRAVDNFYLYAGRRLELLLGKVATRMGKGPVVTAKRILRRHANMMSMTTWHDQYCRCYDCRFQREFGYGDDEDVDRSSAALRKLQKRIKKDCRRLVGYAKSEQYSTQRQAIDSILDVATYDSDLRSILLAYDAGKAVSDVVRMFENFRFNDYGSEVVLLNSSRKALVSLDDFRLNKLLREFIDISKRFEDENLEEERFKEEILDDETYEKLLEEANSVWGEIVPYLWKPYHAFLVMRMLRGRIDAFWQFTIKESVLRNIITSVIDSPGYFEWDECEAVLRPYVEELNPESHMIESTRLYDWLLQTVHRIPKLLGSEKSKLNLLQKDVFRLDGFGFASFHIVQGGVERIMMRYGCEKLTLEWLESRYKHELLRPLLSGLACPLMGAVRKCIGQDSFFLSHPPSDDEICLYEKIVQYIDDANTPELRARAWNYIDYFIASDGYRRHMVLKALSRTPFGQSDSFSKFTEERKKGAAPKLNKNSRNRKYFRHRDPSDSAHYWNERNGPCCSDTPKDIEVLEVFEDWLFDIRIDRGEPFQSDWHYPLPAGYDENGARTYAADVCIPSFACTSLGYCFEEPTFVLNDGTKPEDLRVEVRCPHQTTLLVPTRFNIPALRYTSEACAEVLGCDAGSLFTTGPFSWESVEQRKDMIELGCYEARLMTVEEALSSGYSEDEVYPEVEEPRFCRGFVSNNHRTTVDEVELVFDGLADDEEHSESDESHYSCEDSPRPDHKFGP